MSNEYRHLADAGLGGVSSVVATLPAAYTLGEARFDKTLNLKYKLVFNAGNSQINPGQVCKPVGSSGPYSMTLTTVTGAFNHIGAGVVYNATLTTATYGWMAVQGRVGGLFAAISSVPTGSAFYVATDGSIDLHAINSSITGNIAIGINLGGAASKTITTGAKSGDAVVAFPEI